MNIFKRIASFANGLMGLFAMVLVASMWFSFALGGVELYAKLFSWSSYASLSWPEFVGRIVAGMAGFLLVRFAPVSFNRHANRRMPTRCARKASEHLEQAVTAVIDGQIASIVQKYPKELQPAMRLAHGEIVWKLLEREESFQEAAKLFVADSMIPVNADKVGAALVKTVRELTRDIVDSRAFEDALSGPVYSEVQTLADERKRDRSKWEPGYAVIRLEELMYEAECKLAKDEIPASAPWLPVKMTSWRQGALAGRKPKTVRVFRQKQG